MGIPRNTILMQVSLLGFVEMAVLGTVHEVMQIVNKGNNVTHDQMIDQ